MRVTDTAWCLAAASFLLIAMYSFWSQINKDYAARLKLDILRESASTYAHRWAALNSHAADYLLSLGSAGMKECLKISNLLGQVDNLVSEAECLLCSGDRKSRVEATRLLSYQYDAMAWSYRNSSASDFPNADWETRCEELFQAVGARIVQASNDSKSIHLPSIRQKNPSTLSELSRLGILAAMRKAQLHDASVRSLLTRNKRIL